METAKLSLGLPPDLKFMLKSVAGVECPSVAQMVEMGLERSLPEMEAALGLAAGGAGSGVSDAEIAAKARILLRKAAGKGRA